MFYVAINENIINPFLSRNFQKNIQKSVLQNVRQKFPSLKFLTQNTPVVPEILKLYSTVSRKEKSLIWKRVRTFRWNSLEKNFKERSNKSLAIFTRLMRKYSELTWPAHSTKLQP